MTETEDVYLASYRGHTNRVRTLLSQGVDVNLPDDELGVTPLCLASENGFV